MLSCSPILSAGIKHHWVKHPAYEAAYNETDKTVVRDNILEALFRMAPDKQLRTMLAEALNQVAAHDFPERWPALPVASSAGHLIATKALCLRSCGLVSHCRSVLRHPTTDCRSAWRACRAGISTACSRR